MTEFNWLKEPKMIICGDGLTCSRDEQWMQLEGHDRFRQIPEESFDRARQSLGFELERIVETER